ncbi:protein javelin [Chironomus tepperi]|uniref:protein javelin n=1 Tax=Chironomus tepperi TaxID=113505 RepID=UPI00391F179F
MRNSDCISNYVDRVRICDTKSIASESVYSKASSSQKSGWRQKSYSSIDLTGDGDYQPGAGAFRYRDFDSQDDISIKNIKNNKNKEIQRDYEDIYNVNPKAQGYKKEIIKEHNKINQNKRDNNDVCSLRRSKSLAVIREETFNDLTIDGPKTRRSQLIPRAKLIDRNFFRNRLSFALEEGLSFSLDSNLTSEQLKSSSNTNSLNNINSCTTKDTTSTVNNSNSTNNNSSNNTSNNYFSWNCDKSDLGSIDSNFFKNSLHQTALLEKSNLQQLENSSKFVSRAEVHNENNSNTDNCNDSGTNNNIVENGSVKSSKEKSENVINNNNNNNKNNTDNENSVNINEDTESGITIIEIKDKKHLSGPTSSVISYDSIYLSSESDKQTVIGEEEFPHFDDIDSKIKDFEKIIKELNLIGESEKSDTLIDNLYCQVAKGSCGNLFDLKLSTEEDGEVRINPDTLSKYTDYISKGTLERLAILSGFSTISSNSRKIEGIKNKKKSKDYEPNNSPLSENKGHLQYSSLPDVDISKLLRDCELIDAKLRDDASIELLEPYPDYDIDIETNDSTISESLNIDDINNYGSNNRKQEEKVETKDSIESLDKYQKVNSNNNNTINTHASLNEPTSLEQENPKGAPSIELVQLPTKEFEDEDHPKEERVRNTTKIYIPDLGLELDYENSIASFNSDEDYESPTDELDEHHYHNNSTIRNTSVNFHPFYKPESLNLITISGKKVIVDELAAKSEHHKENKESGNKEQFEVVSGALKSSSSSSFTEKPKQKNNNNIERERKKIVEEKEDLEIFEVDSPLHTNKEESSQRTKKITEKINGADNSSQRHKINTDKRGERTIKLPECKQASKYNVDSSSDKKIVFRNNSDFDDNYYSTAAIIEKEVIQSVSDCERVDNSVVKVSKTKDFTSFCILQKSNSINSNLKMPRPQLLNIIDSKNSTPKLQQQSQIQQHQQQHKQRTTISNNVETNKDGRTTLLNEPEEKLSSPTLELNETEKEFLHKVDSVRNYWSRMLDNEAIEIKENNLKSMSKAFTTSKSSNDIPQSIRNEEGFQSFFPTVEIIELNNGETQAALVTARKLNDVEFDHVRYKVMKSEMFQKNIARSSKYKKETQFDGLMQYLQDYSFQELLANNNVVIIEPVRTKIEKVSEKPNKSQSAICKITNGAPTKLNRSGSNNLKKHFFYHPIRVNKELYEDELPVPDTVRNVRKLFEDSLRLGCPSSTLSERDSKMSKSSDSLKPRKTIRYLTIDTSFDNNLSTSKWDSISLSSGVSSAADLSSPCECQENNLGRNVCNSNSSSNGSKENLDKSYDSGNAGMEKAHLVTTDVLDKMRECGSSITYYGQSVATNQMFNESHKINPEIMSKVVTKDVGVLREKCNCHGRQFRNNFSSSNEKYQQQQQHQLHNKMNNDYTGLKFKLVKSNSCSSRLELAGTGVGELNAVEEMRNIVHGQRNQLYDENEEDDGETMGDEEYENEHKEDYEHEETVKDMIYKLEAKNFVTTTKPRIIESRCIEKVPRDAKVTINNQTFEKSGAKRSASLSSLLSPSLLSQNSNSNIDLHNEAVTVNNHISILKSTADIPAVAESNNPNDNVDTGSSNKISSVKPKIVRNKNVDLALIAVNKQKENAKNPKGFSSDTESMLLAQNDNNNEIHEVSNNHHHHKNNGIKSRNLISSTTMQSVEMVKNQDKINSAHYIKNQASASLEISTLSLQKSTLVESKISPTDEELQQQPVKMVNWGTVGILSKEFIANDNKLIQIKPYDEMEFEEFEVAGEHYDSLNSK